LAPLGCRYLGGTPRAVKGRVFGPLALLFTVNVPLQFSIILRSKRTVTSRHWDPPISPSVQLAIIGQKSGSPGSWQTPDPRGVVNPVTLIALVPRLTIRIVLMGELLSGMSPKFRSPSSAMMRVTGAPGSGWFG
jgi:hypothetical protein